MISDIPPSSSLLSLFVTDTVSGWKIAFTIFLVLLNGFFVAAEFAIVKVRSSQISGSDASPKVMKAARIVTNNLDNYLAATQLGITIASLGLGWVGESVMEGILIKGFEYFPGLYNYLNPHKVAAPLGFIIITVMHIVFGELAPKSIAIRKSAPTTMAVAIPLRIFYFLFKPVIYVMNGFANLILKLIGITPVKEQDIHTEEEIKLIISESEEGGAIEDSERELINNVFDFDSRRVKDILTHRKDLVSFSVDTPFDELSKEVIEEGYSRYPIYEKTPSDFIGILNIKDVLKYYQSNKDEFDIRSLLRPVFYIPESMKIKDLLKAFQKDHVQMAVVTDEYGDIAGIVTMEDILEELVGDIQDEHDAELPIVEKQADDSYIVDAHQPLEDINEFLPSSLPEEEEYNTLSGLITYEHGSVPVEGEVLVLEGYEMIILKMYRSSVEKVRMRLLSEEELEQREKEEEKK